MSTFSEIIIIYNPNSTGPSKELAEKFQRVVKKIFPRKTVELLPTKYAGHAEKIALNHARSKKKPLIVSSSGDGGYHEVVNGVVQSKNKHATAGLLPAGNANDHYHSLHTTQPTTLIKKMQTRKIDLLKLEGRCNGKPLVRYAHSYIGFGITPKAGKELNKTTLNQLNEKWIVLKTFLTFRPTRLIIDGKLKYYDSLIFSNIPRMSKLITLSDKAKIDDGLFEITPVKRRSKTALFKKLLRAATTGLDEPSQANELSLRTFKRTIVQLDGEVYHLDANSSVHISCVKQTLNVLI